MHSATKPSHQDNRRKVCGPCGQKVSKKIEGLIKKFINSDYNIIDDKFPLIICCTCNTTLLEADKNVFKRPFQSMPHYETLVLLKGTRANADECNCYICLLARYKGHVKVIKGRGHRKALNHAVEDSTKGRFGLLTNISQLPKKNHYQKI